MKIAVFRTRVNWVHEACIGPFIGHNIKFWKLCFKSFLLISIQISIKTHELHERAKKHKYYWLPTTLYLSLATFSILFPSSTCLNYDCWLYLCLFISFHNRFHSGRLGPAQFNKIQDQLIFWLCHTCNLCIKQTGLKYSWNIQLPK